MFKLAVGNAISFPVTLNLMDGAQARQFRFTLSGNRMSQDEMHEEINHPGKLLSDILLASCASDPDQPRITGWSGQRLVLNEDGTPAEFSREAFAAMLSFVGVPRTIFDAYSEACGNKAKN